MHNRRHNGHSMSFVGLLISPVSITLNLIHVMVRFCNVLIDWFKIQIDFLILLSWITTSTPPESTVLSTFRLRSVILRDHINLSSYKFRRTLHLIIRIHVLPLFLIVLHFFSFASILSYDLLQLNLLLSTLSSVGHVVWLWLLICHLLFKYRKNVVFVNNLKIRFNLNINSNSVMNKRTNLDISI